MKYCKHGVDRNCKHGVDRIGSIHVSKHVNKNADMYAYKGVLASSGA